MLVDVAGLVPAIHRLALQAPVMFVPRHAATNVFLGSRSIRNKPCIIALSARITVIPCTLLVVFSQSRITPSARILVASQIDRGAKHQHGSKHDVLHCTMIRGSSTIGCLLDLKLERNLCLK